MLFELASPELCHPKTLAGINHLGELWIQEGNYGAAEPLLREALAGFERAGQRAAGIPNPNYCK
ncbi:hypothetical protein SBA4_3790004 [Candidatus Sulfopaludibacter sp. SbA4]|nr:hypothetical protein SBA4_3790004 [Candidatus Sulfopaludibacter sp. SbA4]